MAIIGPGPDARQCFGEAGSVASVHAPQPVVRADLRPVAWAGFDIVGR